jgi:hypothetical protein
MRVLLCVLCLCAAVRAEYEPLRVTVIEYSPLTAKRIPRAVQRALCIKVRGVDYDLEPLLAEYRVEWSWPGGTEQSLRDHLRDDHGVTGIETLSDREIRKLHAVLHERTKRTARAASGPPIVTFGPVRSSACPGGVCPVPSRSRVTLFGRRFGWVR